MVHLYAVSKQIRTRILSRPCHIFLSYLYKLRPIKKYFISHVHGRLKYAYEKTPKRCRQLHEVVLFVAVMELE